MTIEDINGVNKIQLIFHHWTASEHNPIDKDYYSKSEFTKVYDFATFDSFWKGTHIDPYYMDGGEFTSDCNEKDLVDMVSDYFHYLHNESDAPWANHGLSMSAYLDNQTLTFTVWDPKLKEAC